MGQQQLQQGNVELQEKQQQLKDQQAVTTAMQQWDGKDYNQLYPLVLKNGGSGQAVIGLQQKAMEKQKAVAEMAKSDSETGKNQVETLIKKHDIVSGALSTVMQAPDDQLPAALSQTAQQLHQQGLIDPQHFQMATQLAQSGAPAEQLRSQIDYFRKSNMAESQLAAEAKTKAEQQKALDEHAKSQAELPGVQAEATKKVVEADNEQKYGGLSEAAAKAKYLFLLNQQKLGRNIGQTDSAWAKAYEASQQKTTTSSDSLGIKSVNTSGPSGFSGGGRGASVGGGAGSPAESSPGNSLVDEIGQGKMAINRLDNILTRRPELAQAVAQKYPDFDSSKVKAYQGTYDAFTHGADAKSINAGAVAIRHLHDLKQINDDNPAESRIPGTAAYKAFHNLLDTVADELVTFYGEPKTNEAMASKKATLGGLTNRDAAILEQAKAMGIKFDEMEQKWMNAAPSKAYQAPMPGMSEKAMKARADLDPEYAQTYQQRQSASTSGAAQGGGNSSLQVTDPRGVVHTFSTKQAADAFKKAAGIAN